VQDGIDSRYPPVVNVPVADSRPIAVDRAGQGLALDSQLDVPVANENHEKKHTPSKNKVRINAFQISSFY